jgi:hypothetical protein
VIASIGGLAAIVDGSDDPSGVRAHAGRPHTLLSVSAVACDFRQ